MEPIAHLEWTLGISLIMFTFLDFQISALGFFLIGIGAVFPDLFDWAILRENSFLQGHRELSHTVFFITGLIILSFIAPPLGYLTFGSILHIFEDIVAGGNPVYPFSPLTHRGGLIVVNKDQSIRFGAWVRNFIKGSFEGSENIGDELSWYWFLTIVGSWLLIVGIFLYFS